MPDMGPTAFATSAQTAVAWATHAKVGAVRWLLSTDITTGTYFTPGCVGSVRMLCSEGVRSATAACV